MTTPADEGIRAARADDEIRAASEMKCRNCGHEGADVGYHTEYVGGKGITRTGPFCNDRRDCWRRWDAEHFGGIRREQIGASNTNPKLGDRPLVAWEGVLGVDRRYR